MKKVLLLCAILFTVILFAQETQPATTVVAEVNGVPITMAELDREANLNRLLVQIQSIDDRFYEVLTGTTEGMNLLLRYKREVLNNLIDQVLIKQMAEKMNIVIQKEDIEKMVSDELNKTLTQYGMTETDLDWYLKQSGLGDLESFKDRLRWVFSVQKAVTLIQQQVTSSATVTEEEAKDFYEQNKDYFAVEEAVKLLRIIVDSKEKADKVLERIRSGEEFSQVASDVSIDPLTKGKAGDLGWVERNSGLIAADIEEKIFASPKGSMLGPLQSTGGWEIYRILDKRPKGYEAFEDVANDIYQYLTQQKSQQFWQDWITQQFIPFKNSSTINIYLLTEGGQANQ
ncbi:MAG TPA: peptidyl-prolyl cis-trans isomerase [Pseudothermotoga sp.]|nr:peptidyl-prolyl cis-trans isomerase [Pseudothermotoga sp.]HOK83510.1 peptidyl-prolyl cis-trans isomerase [Pseudothermotoga sp.]HPP69583.1 peptidyl-prolyl cis-trans isomerase [Pseudothermotoga sp.]